MNLDAPQSVCIVQPDGGSGSETFIRAHIERLPAKVTVVHGHPPRVDGRLEWPQTLPMRVARKAWRAMSREVFDHQITSDLVVALRRINPSVVLAEYGPTGVQVRESCRRLGIPLIVHFHGWDASRRDVLEMHRQDYEALFRDAAAIIAVSRTMAARLVALGAPARKVHRNPCGVDCKLFHGARPATAAPVLLAVGRFVDKKCPDLTIAAFAAAARRHPEARLRMIGDGPLLEPCRALAKRLGVEAQVSFLGPQPPDVVRQQMQYARAFVQHSAEAPTGDSEGLPVSILEASASGLPIISTRHAGIPEVVLENETGVLVDERDIVEMTAAMVRLIEDPALAGRMGEKGRARVAAEFAIERTIGGLWQILSACVN